MCDRGNRGNSACGCDRNCNVEEKRSIKVDERVWMLMIKDASDFEDKVTYLIIIQLVVIACTFIPTEIKLHQIFTKEGKRKLCNLF